jgi:hypothetical protein
MKTPDAQTKPTSKKPVVAASNPAAKAKVQTTLSKGVQAKAKPAAPATKKSAQSTVSKAAASQTTQTAKTPKAAKPANEKKPKLVRDSFTLPQADHELIKQCKKTALAAGRETKKSEVVRAAIQSFAALPAARQIAAYGKLQAIALGRPKGN